MSALGPYRPLAADRRPADRGSPVRAFDNLGDRASRLTMLSPDQTARFRLRGGERWRSPWGDYAWLRNHDPVHRATDAVFGEYVVLSRFQDVFDAVRDTATFSSAQGLTLDPDVMKVFEGRAAPIVMMDPPVHTSMRRLVSRPMTPSRVAPFETAITDFVDARLDEIDRLHGTVDIVAQLLKPLPSFVVAHYLGVSAGGPAALRWLDRRHRCRQCVGRSGIGRRRVR